VRPDVGVTRIGEVAVGRATNETAVAGRVEPAQRLSVGDERRRRLLRLLMVSLTTATPIATVASAVAVELLILRAPAVVATLVALVPVMVPVFARLPGLPRLSGFPRSRLVLAELSRGRLLLLTWLTWLTWLTRLTRLRRGLASGRRRRGRGGRDVLDANGCLGTRRRLGHVAVIGRSLRAPVEVRVRLASVIGGRTAVRARPTAATMRASTFGHATMFVMGYLLAVAPASAGLHAVLL
jgi:hypothetical protein